jgi:hypothetical protein
MLYLWIDHNLFLTRCICELCFTPFSDILVGESFLHFYLTSILLFLLVWILVSLGVDGLVYGLYRDLACGHPFMKCINSTGRQDCC